MLDSWIIEEIKRRQQEKREQPFLELPLPPPPEPKRPEPKPKGGTVIVIDL